jgi:hypothetical protein
MRIVSMIARAGSSVSRYGETDIDDFAKRLKFFISSIGYEHADKFVTAVAAGLVLLFGGQIDRYDPTIFFWTWGAK